MPDSSLDPSVLHAELIAWDKTRLKVDRYRDFRQVFLNSEAGKRVLLDLMARGHYHKISAVLNMPDPKPELRTYLLEGERNFILWVLDVLHREPKPPLLKQNTREEDNVHS